MTGPNFLSSFAPDPTSDESKGPAELGPLSESERALRDALWATGLSLAAPPRWRSSKAPSPFDSFGAAAFTSPAVGLAWASKLQAQPRPQLVVMDPSTPFTPDGHNALNFAAVFDVPCAFVSLSSLLRPAKTYGLPLRRVSLNQGAPFFAEWSREPTAILVEMTA